MLDALAETRGFLKEIPLIYAALCRPLACGSCISATALERLAWNFHQAYLPPDALSGYSRQPWLTWKKIAL